MRNSFVATMAILTCLVLGCSESADSTPPKPAEWNSVLDAEQAAALIVECDRACDQAYAAACENSAALDSSCRAGCRRQAELVPARCLVEAMSMNGCRADGEYTCQGLGEPVPPASCSDEFQDLLDCRAEAAP